MNELLFKPKKFDLPGRLILIPRFWHREYYAALKEEAATTLEILQCEIPIFADFTLIEGFLGYPHILTILEFIENVREKEIFFLGTAGSLNEQIDHPMPLQVTEIYSSAILKHFAAEESFQLKPFAACDFRKAAGVTVDIIQRETLSWLKEQKSKGLDFVEMELFPLRVYLGKPFYAIVVTSDILKETGGEFFLNKKLLKKEFVKAYEQISTSS